MVELTEYRTYAYAAVFTQANAAGGAIVVDFLIGDGNWFYVLWAFGQNSGTNGVKIGVTDTNNVTVILWTGIASGAGTIGVAPQSATNSATAGQVADSSDISSRLVSGTDKFTVFQTAAGAQNDTFTVRARFLCNEPTPPAMTKARSTNQANVTPVNDSTFPRFM